MPIKITKKSKRTKKGKGKVTQSQQVIVNIQKGKRKASSKPVMRQSQPPIIIQQPQQQDYSQLENLFKQYSTSRSVAEPKPVTMGMETQTETPIMVDKQTQVKSSNPVKLEQELTKEQLRLQEKLLALEAEKPIPVARQRQPAPQRPRQILSPFPVRQTAPAPTPDKVVNPETNRMINVGGSAYKKLVKDGKIIP